MIDNPKASVAEKDTVKSQLIVAQQTLNHYGKGSDLQLAVRAVTGVLQGIMAKDTNQAIVVSLSPYVNQFIKRKTEDKTTANLMAHALLGAIEAKAIGNNALAGATAGVVGETTAQLITERLYNKQPKDLTEQEKNTVTALSQIASGLSAGLVGDSSQAGLAGMEIGKRAVEDNSNLNTMAIGSTIGLNFARENNDCNQNCKHTLNQLELNIAEKQLIINGSIIGGIVALTIPTIATNSSIIAGGFSGASDWIGQYIEQNGDLSKIDYIDVGSSAITGVITKDMGLKSVVSINTAVAVGNALRKNENPYSEVAISSALSIIGYKSSSKIEKILDKKFNLIWKEYDFVENHVPYPILTPHSKNNIPYMFGSVTDNFINIYSESKIKTYQKGNDDK